MPSSTKKKPDEVPADRRRNDRRAAKGTAGPADEVPQERRKVQRRRQIDPTTCERDYTNDEIEFMQALDVYKRRSGRMFPTCSEILEVVRDLGYVRLFDAEGTPVHPWATELSLEPIAKSATEEATPESVDEEEDESAAS